MHLPVRLLKKILISLLSATFVLVASGLVLHLRIPTIKANNVTAYKNQISTNSPLIMKFSQLMNRSSVEKHFSIFPEVRGEFDWTLNTLVFTPEERLKVGETYTLTVTKDATNILGKNLEEDYIVHFLVVDPPKVSLAVPIKETNVDSKITIMFDRPLVELTTLDELEKKPVPLVITPEIKGRAKWIGTSSFQFIPETRLDYSTEYTATVPAGLKTLDEGMLEADYIFTFSTPRIALQDLISEKEHSASVPFILPFNQEVNKESIFEHVKVLRLEDDEKDSDEGDVIAVTVAYQKRKEEYKDDRGETHFRQIEDKKIVELMPKEGSWAYDTKYSFSLDEGIAGIEGNLKSTSSKKNIFKTGPFIREVLPQNADSSANPKGDIILEFEESANLGSFEKNFAIQPQASFDFNYGKKCKPGWEPEKSPDEECPKVMDDTKILATPKSPLANVSDYTITINKDLEAKNGLKYLKNDFVWKFKTADVIKILRTGTAVQGDQYEENIPRTYKNICIFSPTRFDTKDLEKQFIFNPPLKRPLSFATYSFSTPESSQYAPCKPNNQNERHALLLNAYMNPDATYSITLKAGTKDTFGQILEKDAPFTWKTESLDERDISLDLVQTNFYAFVTPDEHAKPLFASQNLDSFTLEVCRITAERFLEIDTQFQREAKDDYRNADQYGWKGFTPSSENCAQYISKTITNPRLYWEKQYVEVDLHEILGKQKDANLAPGYYYIRAQSPRLVHYEYAYSEDGEYTQIRRPFMPGQVIAVTNMHIAMKKSRNTALFWVNDLANGKPLNNVSLALYNTEGKPINKQALTTANGTAKIDLNDLPYQYAVATFGDDTVAMNIYWNEGISAWEYNLNFSETERFIQSYVYTDRPIYQPTHRVHFKGIVRDDYDAQLSVPTGVKSVAVEIRDSRDTTLFKKDMPLSSQGTFNGEFVLSDAVPLGTYYLESCVVKEKSNYGEGDYCARGFGLTQFYVEEYRKPEYKLDASFSSDRYVNGDQMKASIDADYYFGAPVPNAKINWTLKSQNYYFDAYPGEWYSFSDYATLNRCYYGCPYNDSFIADGNGITDSQGKFIITQKLDLAQKDANGKVKPPDTSKLYTLDATVTDNSNRSVGKSSTFVVHRGEFYVGVKTADYLVKAGDRVAIKAISLDPSGKPAQDKLIKIELAQHNWKYVKKKNVDGGFYWENELDRKIINSDSVTTDSEGRAQTDFKVKEGGEYVVTATASDSRGNTFSSSMDFYVTTSDYVSWKQENNNRMELKLDKQNYAIGETAHVLVKSPYPSVKALLSYERGDIFDYKIVDIKSNAQVLDIPITEKMVPNFYVSVLVFKPGNAQSPPDFKLGYADVVVDNKVKELGIGISPDKKLYAPGDTVKLELMTTDHTGKPLPAELSVAVVDESLLALKGNPKKDLLKAFYDRRMLGVSTTDTLTNLLKRINVNDLKGAKGGSGKGLDDSLKPRGKFEDTALWLAQVNTNSNGKAVAEFKLPDNLTTWNIEVVGITKDSHVGVGHIGIVSQKALMVRPVAPRFATYGDSMQIGAIVHNYSDIRESVKVTIALNGILNKDGETKTIKIEPGQSSKVLWNVVIPYDIPSSKIGTITLTADGQSSDDAITWDLPLMQNITPETVSLSSFTDDISFTEKILIPSENKPLAGSLKITTGATVATYVNDALNYLITYPYGCSEQLISSVVPMIILKQALNVANVTDKFKLQKIYDEKGKEISFDAVVNRTIQRIYAAQRSDGGWGYFTTSRESYPYLSAYVLHGLYQLKKAGYAIDTNVYTRGQNFLLSALRDTRDLYIGNKEKPIKTRYWAANRAYMLFVLSEIGSGDLALANSLYDDRSLLVSSGKAYLAMTLHSLGGQSTKVDTLIQDLENNARIDARGTYIRAEDYSGLTMMTNVKTTGLTLQAFTRIKPSHPLTQKIIAWLIAVRMNGTWSTTQETAVVLGAMSEYLQKTGEAQANYAAQISLNEKEIGTYLVNPKNILDNKTFVKTLEDLKTGSDGNKIIFAKEGTGRLYYDLVFNYMLPSEKIKPRSEGFVVQRSYYRLDDEKMQKPVTDAKAGETLRAKLIIIAPEDRTAVAVENFIPAGMEIINFELATADQTIMGDTNDSSFRPLDGALNYDDGYYYGFENYWNHKEIRDDRLLLFADRLSKGVYDYEYYVQVTTSGEFNNPPAVVSELYFPENFARTAGEQFVVRE